MKIICRLLMAFALLVPSSCARFGDEDPTPSTGNDNTVNRRMDDYMKSHYLYNEAYRSVTPVFSKSYDAFLSDVLSQMYRRGANPKDGRPSGSGWAFYSYIMREGATRAVPADKPLTYGYGIDVGFVQMSESSGQIGFFIDFVYPGSPAEKAGLHRGDIIYRIDGAIASRDNYTAIYRDLFEGNHSGVRSSKFTLLSFDGDGRASEGPVVTLTSGSYYATPVVYAAVYEIKGRRIAHLVYTAFDGDFDDDLEAAMQRFRELEAEEIIVDLRYNGGGSVASAQLLASILAGPSCSGRVFTYYRYNDERMAAEKRDPRDYTTYDYTAFSGTAASRFDFGFGRIYVVATSATASASELLINALRGIGKEVVIAASERTNGKDVGMEAIRFTVGTASYIFAPITFQSYNARGQSDYDDGFTPDIKPSKNYEVQMPLEDWGVFYLTSNDYLYRSDFVSDILVDILGNTVYADSDFRILYRSNAGAVTGTRAETPSPVSRTLRRGVFDAGGLMPAVPRDLQRTNMFK